ncbi:biotin carboxyl carrier protein of acetyl-CoA carboxylase [Geofilum rubicundum JCM 15548]|uniref:Biotin carboxyl carrier protein of acetyl-CoA carboxylase n=2 Tax=Geofilum TaxID=1236988 RepID=A0A0E9LYB2_9BACT|nr:biotin carboxyl carrier protein of acetyl-CoA carboxylase [Geofilum rubicundum JCM 15548]
MHVKSGNKEKSIKVLKKEGDIFTVSVGEKTYELDVVKVEEGVYSILNNGNSINMEMIASDQPGNYKVNTLYNSFNIDVLPAVAFSPNGKVKKEAHQLIKSPMPGKIVRVKVKVGDTVEAGTPLIVLSAMKMENEIKSEGKGTVTKVAVKEDDLVKDGQLMIDIKV